MPLSGATGTKWYCEPPPLAESVQTPRSGLSINPHLKWGSLTFLRNLLKDRVYLALAYMTGILPIKKYGEHSALNMFVNFRDN